MLKKLTEPFFVGEEIVKLSPNISKMYCDKNIERIVVEITAKETFLRLTIFEQMKDLGRDWTYFCLVLGESADLSNIDQINIFIRALDDTFDIFEEHIGLESHQGKTGGPRITEKSSDA